MLDLFIRLELTWNFLAVASRFADQRVTIVSPRGIILVLYQVQVALGQTP